MGSAGGIRNRDRTPDRFVIGFGLDYKQLYRNLGYIAVMKPDM